MKVAYPTIFTEVETNILIEIPDLQILTEANEEGKNKKGLAEAAHINVSRVLQEALISKLNINKIV